MIRCIKLVQTRVTLLKELRSSQSPVKLKMLDTNVLNKPNLIQVRLDNLRMKMS